MHSLVWLLEYCEDYREVLLTPLLFSEYPGHAPHLVQYSITAPHQPPEICETSAWCKMDIVMVGHLLAWFRTNSSSCPSLTSDCVTIIQAYLFLEILQNRISRKMNLILKVNVKFLLKVTTNVYSNVYHIKVNTKLYSW